METKEEILNEKLKQADVKNIYPNGLVYRTAIDAMETYAQQQTTKLQADNTSLKEVNEAQAFTIDKYKADKDKLACFVKELETQVNTEKWEASSAANLPEFLRLSKIHNKITETLFECGYNI